MERNPCELICADALEWLRIHSKIPSPLRNIPAIITSLPDAEEVGLSLKDWTYWFADAAWACMAAVGKTGPVVFYQTDRKHDGRLYSKPELLFDSAVAVGLRPLWHKIILRRGVGKTDLHRPGYTHLIAFGGAGVRPGAATPDVIEAGAMLYENAMGANAARVTCEFVRPYGNKVVDPFCGQGAVLVAALRMGMSAVGVDIDPAQIEKARANTDQEIPF